MSDDSHNDYLFWAAASQKVLDTVWDNSPDDVYNGVDVMVNHPFLEKPLDLNTTTINHDGAGFITLAAKPITTGNTTVYFRDLESHLISHINNADAVIGCVAWLTSKTIIEALSHKNPVSLVVQKEDFLRPDIGSRDGWATELRRRYDKLRCTWGRFSMPGIVSWLSTFSDPSIQPIRCVGNHNRDKNPAFPRMHHKFIVLCRTVVSKEDEDTEFHLEPYAVWTGSFNFTENGTRSLENALLITEKDIIDAYVDEWARIVSLSESLDWESEWMTPEWRIGT